MKIKSKIIKIKVMSVLLLSLFFLTVGISLKNRASMRVKTVRTPISELNLARALKEAHFNLFGSYPSKNKLMVAWAQVGIENRRGKSVYNHNLGNISSRKTVPYYVLAGRSYLSFKSFNDGAIGYWKVIHRMCKSSIPYFEKGYSYAAALQLKKCGYYEANEKEYARQMTRVYIYGVKNIADKI